MSCSLAYAILMTLLLFAGKFNWKGTIKAVLRQSPEEGIAVKKLRKKVALLNFSGSEALCNNCHQLTVPLFWGRLNAAKCVSSLCIYLQSEFHPH